MVALFFGASAALVLHSFLATPAFAAFTNITVDDTNSTVWTFVGGWNAVTPETPCPTCFAQPDPEQVFNSSWHDGSVVSGSLTFQGSAVYIYGIDMTATSGTNISFSMNNPTEEGFHYFGSTGTTYNVLFFSATNLDPTVGHTVSFIGQTSLVGAGAMLFDYAKITVDEEESPPPPAGPSSTAPLPSTPSSTPSSAALLSTGSTSPPPSSLSRSSSPSITASLPNSSTSGSPAASPSPSSSSTPALTTTQKSHTGAIAGAAAGAAGGVAVIIALVLFLRRRRKVRTNGGNFYEAPRTSMSAVEPYRPGAGGASFVGAPVSSSGISTSAAPASTVPPPAPLSTGSSSPVATTSTATPTVTSRSDSKSAQMVLAWDPESARAREVEMEQRLRQLEDLVRPPEYHD